MIAGAKWRLKTNWLNIHSTFVRNPDVVVWDDSHAAVNDREGCARMCLSITETKPCVGFNYPDYKPNDPNENIDVCRLNRVRDGDDASESMRNQYYELLDRNTECIELGNLVFKLDIRSILLY